MTAPGPRIRDVTAADHEAILAINNAAVPAMNALTADSLQWLADHAVYFCVVDDADGVAAFLIGLPPAAGYDSVNYRWFAERYASFVYIDRIAVAERARGLGHGSALYDDIARFARGRRASLLAEVNLDPPNPRSLVFHERHGFVPVGEMHLSHEGAYAKHVRMFRRELT